MSKHCQRTIRVLHVSLYSWQLVYVSLLLFHRPLAVVMWGITSLRGVTLDVLSPMLSTWFGCQAFVLHLYLLLLCRSGDGKMDGMSTFRVVRD